MVVSHSRLFGWALVLGRMPAPLHVCMVHYCAGGAGERSCLYGTLGHRALGFCGASSWQPVVEVKVSASGEGGADVSGNVVAQISRVLEESRELEWLACLLVDMCMHFIVSYQDRQEEGASRSILCESWTESRHTIQVHHVELVF